MKAVLYAKELKRIIDATQIFTAKDTIGGRAEFAYIRLDFSKQFCTVTGIGIDGYRLSVETAACVEVEEDFTVYIKPMLPKSKVNSMASIESNGDFCYITVDGAMTGYKQPKADAFNYENVLPKAPPTFKIAFNARLLLDAIKAAVLSAGYKEPTVLEFQSNIDPVIIRTGKQNVKMVLPIRMKGE
jgi:DNA polymerase III sliding clamp (beta) subunit (PCNA family)